MANENNDDKLIIEIELDDGKLVKGFVNAKSVAGKAGKDAGKDFGDGVNTEVGLGLDKLKSSFLGIAAVIAGAFTLNKMIDEAVAGEAAISSLNNSLRMSGEFTPLLSSQIQSYAGNLSALTGRSSEAILEQFALAKSLNATSEQAQLITTAAQGMATALKIDASSAVMRITQTLNGSAGSLGRVVDGVSELTEKQLKAGAAIELVNAQFREFAAINKNTFTGSRTSFFLAFSDLLKSFGEIVVKSPLVIATFQVLTEKIRGATAEVTKLSSPAGLGRIGEVAIATGGFIRDFIILPIEQTINIMKLSLSVINLWFNGAIGALGQVTGKMADFLNFFGVDNKATQALQLFRESSAEVFTDMLNNTKSAWDGLFDYPFSSQTDSVISEIEAVAQKVSDATANAASNAGNALKSTREEVSKTTKDIANMIQNGLVRSVSTGIQAVGASFVQGGGAFKDFGNQIIGIMGDLAIQVGTAILFTGEAIEILRTSIATAVGIPAIAAGIALIALGGALKAFASKSSATAQQNSAIPQTGGGSFGSNPHDQNVITQPETEKEKLPEINVIIQGDVLDSQESGRRIVDIINSAFDREGLKIRRGAIS